MADAPEPDRMTVLTTFGPLATKTLGRDPVTGKIAIVASYDDAAHFRVRTLPVATLPELHATLTFLAAQSRSLVIRGELLPDADPKRCRRLLHPALERDGSLTPAMFREAARRWLAADFDSVDCPAGLDWIHDPYGTVSHLALMLPAEFENVGSVIQATSGANVSPGIRVRVWYLTDRPVSGSEAKRWLAHAPVDPSIFRAVQPIYTAAPLLQGAADPMHWRMVLVPGREDRVAVPEPAALAPPRIPSPGAGTDTPEWRAKAHAIEVRAAAGSHAYAHAALAGECREIAGTVRGRHERLNRAAFKLGRFVAGGDLARGDVIECLIAAAEAAGLEDGEPELRRFLACGLNAGLRGANHAS